MIIPSTECLYFLAIVLSFLSVPLSSEAPYVGSSLISAVILSTIADPAHILFHTLSPILVLSPMIDLHALSDWRSFPILHLIDRPVFN